MTVASIIPPPEDTAQDPKDDLVAPDAALFAVIPVIFMFTCVAIYIATQIYHLFF